MRKNFSFRVISAALIVLFLLQDISWADASSLIPKSPVFLSKDILSRPDLLQTPEDFCILKEIHQGDQGKPFIIHIQDAHTNLSGQQNLAKTLDHLMTQYKITDILVEGGGTDGTLDPIKRLAPPEIIHRVSKKLLMEGKIAGEEYLNLTSAHKMKILGVENMALYEKSVENYAKLADKREAILTYLGLMERSLEKLKNKLYPAEILSYEKQKEKDAEGTLGFKFKELLNLANLKQVSLKDFPNLQKLAALEEKEGVIDFNQANLEQAALMEELEGKGEREKVKGYLEKMSQVKGQRASQFSHFQKIFEISKEKNLDLGKYPNLGRYFDYLKSFMELDLEKTLDEFTRLEDRVYMAWLSTGGTGGEASIDTRMLRAIDRYLALLNIAYRIQMSTKDFEFFKANEPDFSTAAYQAFLNRKLAELGYFTDIIPYKNILEEGKIALEDFYASVSQRDLAFMKNIQSATHDPKSAIQNHVVVLITGGYHTQHLKQLFREAGYSYAVVAPIVTSETNQQKYEKLLLSGIRKETKRVEVVQGETKINKSLSRLDADMAKLLKKEGVRYRMAAARFEEILPEFGGDESERRLVGAVFAARLSVSEPSQALSTLMPEGARLAARVTFAEAKKVLQQGLDLQKKGENKRAERAEKKAFSLIGSAIQKTLKPRIFKTKPFKLMSYGLKFEAPLRIDFANGLGSDLFVRSMERGGKVLNGSIMIKGKKPIEVTVKPIKALEIRITSVDTGKSATVTRMEDFGKIGRFDDSLKIYKAALIEAGIIPGSLKGDLNKILQEIGGGIEIKGNVKGIPVGSGLGVSSVLGGVLLKALFEVTGMEIGDEELILRVINLEQKLGSYGGWQDLLAVFPGIKWIQAQPGDPVPTLKELLLSQQTLKKLKSRMILIYTGEPHFSGDIQKQVITSYLLRREPQYSAMLEAERITKRMYQALLEGDITKFGSLATLYWRQTLVLLGEEASNKIIDIVMKEIRGLGEGRVMGAGGGGFMFVIGKPGKIDELRKRLARVLNGSGGKIIDYDFDFEGVTVKRLNPDRSFSLNFPRPLFGARLARLPMSELLLPVIGGIGLLGVAFVIGQISLGVVTAILFFGGAALFLWMINAPQDRSVGALLETAPESTDKTWAQKILSQPLLRKIYLKLRYGLNEISQVSPNIPRNPLISAEDKRFLVRIYPQRISVVWYEDGSPISSSVDEEKNPREVSITREKLANLSRLTQEQIDDLFSAEPYRAVMKLLRAMRDDRWLGLTPLTDPNALALIQEFSEAFGKRSGARLAADYNELIQKTVASYDLLAREGIWAFRFGQLNQAEGRAFFSIFESHLLDEGPIIDAATSLGRFAGYFKARYPSRRILGVDLSQEMLQRATVLNPGPEYLRFDIRNISPSLLGLGSGEKAAGAVIGETFSHIPGQDAGSFLKNLSETLQDGAPIFVNVVTDKFFEDPRFVQLARVSGALNSEGVTTNDKWGRDGWLDLADRKLSRFFKIYTVEELRSVLEKNGFEVKDIHLDMSRPFPGEWIHAVAVKKPEVSKGLWGRLFGARLADSKVFIYPKNANESQAAEEYLSKLDREFGPWDKNSARKQTKSLVNKLKKELERFTEGKKIPNGYIDDFLFYSVDRDIFIELIRRLSVSADQIVSEANLQALKRSYEISGQGKKDFDLFVRGQSDLSKIGIRDLLRSFHLMGTEIYYRESTFKLLSGLSRDPAGRTLAINQLTEIDEKIARLAQWDFAHRFNGAIGMTVISGASDNRWDNYELNTPVSLPHNNFFTYLPEHSLEFIFLDSDSPEKGVIAVADVPIQSIRHTVWANFYHGYEAQIIAKGNITLRRKYDASSMKENLDLLNEWAIFKSAYIQDLSQLAEGLDAQDLEDRGNKADEWFIRKLVSEFQKVIGSEPEFADYVKSYEGAVTRSIKFFNGDYKLADQALKKIRNELYLKQPEEIVEYLDQQFIGAFSKSPGRAPVSEAARLATAAAVSPEQMEQVRENMRKELLEGKTRMVYVFAGGGGKGVVLPDVIEMMSDGRLRDSFWPVALYGTSVGAITALLLAAGFNLQEIKDFAKDESFLKSLSERRGGRNPFFSALTHGGAYPAADFVELLNRKLKEKFTRELQKSGVTINADQIPDITFEDLPFPLTVIAADVSSGNSRRFEFSRKNTPKTRVVDAIRASMSVPGFFEPYEVKFVDQKTGMTDTRLFVDGGLLQNDPVAPAVRDEKSGLWSATGIAAFGFSNLGVWYLQHLKEGLWKRRVLGLLSALPFRFLAVLTVWLTVPLGLLMVPQAAVLFLAGLGLVYTPLWRVLRLNFFAYLNASDIADEREHNNVYYVNLPVKGLLSTLIFKYSSSLLSLLLGPIESELKRVFRPINPVNNHGRGGLEPPPNASYVPRPKEISQSPVPSKLLPRSAVLRAGSFEHIPALIRAISEIEKGGQGIAEVAAADAPGAFVAFLIAAGFSAADIEKILKNQYTVTEKTYTGEFDGQDNPVFTEREVYRARGVLESFKTKKWGRWVPSWVPFLFTGAPYDRRVLEKKTLELMNAKLRLEKEVKHYELGLGRILNFADINDLRLSSLPTRIILPVLDARTGETIMLDSRGATGDRYTIREALQMALASPLHFDPAKLPGSSGSVIVSPEYTDQHARLVDQRAQLNGFGKALEITVRDSRGSGKITGFLARHADRIRLFRILRRVFTTVMNPNRHEDYERKYTDNVERVEVSSDFSAAPPLSEETVSRTAAWQAENANIQTQADLQERFLKNGPTEQPFIQAAPFLGYRIPSGGLEDLPDAIRRHLDATPEYLKAHKNGIIMLRMKEDGVTPDFSLVSQSVYDAEYKSTDFVGATDDLLTVDGMEALTQDWRNHQKFVSVSKNAPVWMVKMSQMGYEINEPVTIQSSSGQQTKSRGQDAYLAYDPSANLYYMIQADEEGNPLNYKPIESELIEQTQLDLRRRFLQRLPKEVPFIQTTPILGYRILSNGFEGLPEVIRRHLKVDPKYLEANKNSLIALRMKEDGVTPDFYVIGQSTLDADYRTDRIENVPTDDLLRVNGMGDLIEGLVGVLKTAPVWMIKMSQVGYELKDRVTIQTSSGEQTKPEGRDAYLAFDAGANRFYMIQVDSKGNPVNYVPIEGDRSAKTQLDIRQRIRQLRPFQQPFITAAPILGYRIPSDGLEGLPDVIRRHLNVDPKYLEDNKGSIIALRTKEDGTPDFYVVGKSTYDTDYKPVERGGVSTEKLLKIDGMEALIQTGGENLVSVSKTAPVWMIQMSHLGYQVSEEVTIQAPFGEQTKPAGKDAYLAFDPGTNLYYMILADAAGNPANYVPIESKSFEQPQRDIRRRLLQYMPDHILLIKDMPILGYRIQSDKFEDLPKVIRDNIGAVDKVLYTPEYLRANVGSIIALQMKNATTPDFYIIGKDAYGKDYRETTVGEMSQKNKKIFGFLSATPGLRELIEAGDENLVGALKIAPISAFKISDIGYGVKEEIIIQSPFGTQTKQESKDAYAAFDAGTGQYYIINSDDEAHAFSYILSAARLASGQAESASVDSTQLIAQASNPIVSQADIAFDREVINRIRRSRFAERLTGLMNVYLTRRGADALVFQGTEKLQEAFSRSAVKISPEFGRLSKELFSTPDYEKQNKILAEINGEFLIPSGRFVVLDKITRIGQATEINAMFYQFSSPGRIRVVELNGQRVWMLEGLEIKEYRQNSSEIQYGGLYDVINKSLDVEESALRHDSEAIHRDIHDPFFVFSNTSLVWSGLRSVYQKELEALYRARSKLANKAFDQGEEASAQDVEAVYKNIVLTHEAAHAYDDASGLLDVKKKKNKEEYSSRLHELVRDPAYPKRAYLSLALYPGAFLLRTDAYSRGSERVLKSVYEAALSKGWIQAEKTPFIRRTIHWAGFILKNTSLSTFFLFNHGIELVKNFKNHSLRSYYYLFMRETRAFFADLRLALSLGQRIAAYTDYLKTASELTPDQIDILARELYAKEFNGQAMHDIRLDAFKPLPDDLWGALIGDAPRENALLSARNDISTAARLAADPKFNEYTDEIQKIFDRPVEKWTAPIEALISRMAPTWAAADFKSLTSQLREANDRPGALPETLFISLVYYLLTRSREPSLSEEEYRLLAGLVEKHNATPGIQIPLSLASIFGLSFKHYISDDPSQPAEVLKTSDLYQQYSLALVDMAERSSGQSEEMGVFFSRAIALSTFLLGSHLDTLISDSPHDLYVLHKNVEFLKKQLDSGKLPPDDAVAVKKGLTRALLFLVRYFASESGNKVAKKSIGRRIFLFFMRHLAPKSVRAAKDTVYDLPLIVNGQTNRPDLGIRATWRAWIQDNLAFIEDTVSSFYGTKATPIRSRNEDAGLAGLSILHYRKYKATSLFDILIDGFSGLFPADKFLLSSYASNDQLFKKLLDRLSRQIAQPSAKKVSPRIYSLKMANFRVREYFKGLDYFKARRVDLAAARLAVNKEGVAEFNNRRLKDLLDAKAGEFDIQAAIDELKKHPYIAKNNSTGKNLFEEGVGVWEGYTLEEHTFMVIGQFEKYFKEGALPGDIDRSLFRTSLLLHDIGKPIVGGTVGQHDTTKNVILNNLKDDLPIDAKDLQFLISLVDGDPIGIFLKSPNGENLKKSADSILDKARKLGLDANIFFNLLTIYYQSDASSYTSDATKPDGQTKGILSLDYLFKRMGSGSFVFNKEKRRMDFAGVTEQNFEWLNSEIHRLSNPGNSANSATLNATGNADDEINQAWKKALAPGTGFYLVHAIPNQSGFLMRSLHAISEKDSDPTRRINLLETPERIFEKSTISASYIGPGKTGTFEDMGFILEVPPENILRTNSSDMGSDFTKGGQEYVQNFFNNRSIQTPAKLFEETKPSTYNEVLVAGTNPSDMNRQTKILGIFFKKTLSGKILAELNRPKEYRELLLLASARKLPIIYFVEEPLLIIADKPANIIFNASGWSAAYTASGTIYSIRVDNVGAEASVITDGGLHQRRMTPEEFDRLRDLIRPLPDFYKISQDIGVVRENVSANYARYKAAMAPNGGVPLAVSSELYSRALGSLAVSDREIFYALQNWGLISAPNEYQGDDLRVKAVRDELGHSTYQQLLSGVYNSEIKVLLQKFSSARLAGNITKSIEAAEEVSIRLEQIFQVKTPSQPLAESDIHEIDNETVRLFARWYLALQGKGSELAAFQLNTKNGLVRMRPHKSSLHEGEILFYHDEKAASNDSPFAVIPLTETILNIERSTDRSIAEIPTVNKTSIEAEALAANVKLGSLNREGVRLLLDQILALLAENKKVVISQSIDRERIAKDPIAAAEMQLMGQTIIAIKKLLKDKADQVYFEFTDKDGVVDEQSPDNASGLAAGAFKRIYVAQPNPGVLKRAFEEGAGFLALPDMSKGDGLIPFLAVYLSAIGVALSPGLEDGNLAQKDENLERALKSLIHPDSLPLEWSDLKAIHKVSEADADKRREIYFELTIRAIVRVDLPAVLAAARLAIQAVGGAA